MIRLNQTNSQLLSLITAQNGAKVVVSYSDNSSFGYQGNSQVTSITSATTTTICGTPATGVIRDIDHITVVNTYAGSHAITLQISSDATLYSLITATLSSGDTLEYTHAHGIKVLDSSGNIHTSITTAQLIIASGKTLTVNNTLTINGTDGTTMTLPSISATLAKVDGETFTGGMNIQGVVNLPSSPVISMGTNTILENHSQSSTNTVAAAGGTYGVLINQTSAPANLVGGWSSFSVQSTLNGPTGTISTYDVNVAALTLGASNLSTITTGRCFAAGLNIGAGSVTTCVGFNAGSSLGNASTAYGFRGSVVAGTNKWNNYHSGTADNAYVGNSYFGGTTVPTAKVHLAAGTATASTAPLKFTSGTNLTTPEAGAMEYDGNKLYFSPNTTRRRVNISDDVTLPSAITVGASVFTYQNTTNYEAEILITGGTVSLVEFTRDNATFYTFATATGTHLRLAPSDRARVTYSSLPVMTLIPM